MKIEQQGYTGATQEPGRAAGAGSAGSIGGSSIGGISYAESRGTNSGAVGDHGDRAEVSGIAQVFQSAQAARTGQVDRLGELVRGGQYSVDPAHISQSVVAETIAAQGAR
jgi:hypothetical protein